MNIKKLLAVGAVVAMSSAFAIHTDIIEEHKLL